MAQQFDDLIAALRAASEPTRIRILALCEQGDLTVSDLVRILDQSQPSVSQHLKPLSTAGLIERIPEGTSTFCRLARKGQDAAFAQAIIALMPKSDVVIQNDNARYRALKTERATAAAEYFAENAENWARLRALHVDEGRVEATLCDLLKPYPLSRLLDMGTGTGRILELLGPLAESAEGVDLSREMLAIARAKLEAAGLRHCRVRYGDLFDMPFFDGSFDAVTIHQVLHFIDNPEKAIKEAARVLSLGGILAIVDFARHDLENLRTEHKHRHLGFSADDMDTWCADANMRIERVERLEGDPLTVHVWLASKLKSVPPDNKEQQNQEQR